MLLDPFFRISNSIACWPISRSNSAICICSLRWSSSLWKTCGARSKKVAFQAERRSGFRLCSRQTNAVLLMPDSNTNTCFTLNSGVNHYRRVLNMRSYLEHHSIGYPLCPISGAHPILTCPVVLIPALLVFRNCFDDHVTGSTNEVLAPRLASGAIEHDCYSNFVNSAHVQLRQCTFVQYRALDSILPYL